MNLSCPMPPNALLSVSLNLIEEHHHQPVFSEFPERSEFAFGIATNYDAFGMPYI